MQRRTSTFTIVVSAAVSALILGATAALPRPVAAQGVPHCPPGQSAQFMFGIAALQQRLGATMGTPLECEHVNPENGDTIQHTSTGLAYYRPAINTPMFTDGQTHWALSNNQVLMWRNGSVEPPQPTAAESSYLATALPTGQQLDALQARLAYFQGQADAGRLAAVDVADVGTLYDELVTARDMIARTPASARLQSYDSTLVGAIDEAVAAAELLVRARLTEVDAARFAFVGEAASRAAESERLQGSALDAYSYVLPVVVG